MRFIRLQLLIALTGCILPRSSSLSNVHLALKAATTRHIPTTIPVHFERKPSALLFSSAEVASPSREESTGGTSTITASVFNLVKGIVGAGVLALPAGIAAFANAPSAVVPAMAMIAIIGCLSGYGFGLIGRTCALTRTSTYRDAWSESVGESTSWIPAWSVTLKTICATLAYSMILADTFYSLSVTAGLRIPKSITLAAITTFILLPLCLLKNLSSLAPFSLLGTIGMLYTAAAMAFRYVGKAYEPGVGRFVADLPSNLQPSFGDIGAVGALKPAATILISMLSTSYMAHFNAPKFFIELKQNTIPRFLQVVSTSFGISIAIFAAMASLGFLTFGSSCSGLILNNYSVRDGIMGFSRLAVAVSLVFSYPLAFSGFRDGILDLFKVTNRSPGFLNTLTVGLLSFLTVLALIIPDVSFVLALAGATLGNSLIYIYPALMFRGAIQKKVDSPTRLQKSEVKFALGSAVLGLVMGALGTVSAIKTVL